VSRKLQTVMTSLHKFEYPNKEHVHQVAKSLDFSIHADDEDEYLELMRHTLSCYEAINSFEHDKPEIKYPRSEITYPEDNKYNAWFVKSEIVGNNDPNTKLFGKTIAIKDNISVAQLPLINGTDFLQDNYTPGMLTIVHK
jgi:amidase